MSAITVAVLRARRGEAMSAHTAASDAYVAALRKAPQMVVSAHLLRVAAHLVVLAVRVGAGRVRR